MLWVVEADARVLRLDLLLAELQRDLCEKLIDCHALLGDRRRLKKVFDAQVVSFLRHVIELNIPAVEIALVSN